MEPSSAPDPRRLGGIGWLRSTKGALTSAEKRRLAVEVLRGQAQGIAGRLALLRGTRPTSIPDVPSPPDSALAREAEEAAAEQPPAVVGHSYRTWAYGRALAAVDRTASLDDELFYVAALLHDAGIVEPVAGEDFTLRSGEVAARCAAPHRDEADLERLRDAISAHATPGATLSKDGPEGVYVQQGAVLDLGGLRLHELPADYVAEVLARHPRTGMKEAFVPLVKAEAAAVPDGRFALLVKTGFLLAFRIAPFDQE